MTLDHNAMCKIAEGAVNRRPTLSLDVALYDSFLSDSALAEADRHALLESLWAIIVGFVDLGFEVRPTEDSGGQNRKTCENLTTRGDDLVEFPPVPTKIQFEKAAEHHPDVPAETRE